MDNVSYLIYEDNAQYDLWLKLILGGSLAVTLILGFVLLSTDLVAAWICFGVTVFDALLFHAITPRRFQTYTDRLRIVLGWPFVVNLSLATIKEAHAATSNEVFAYWGVRFATSRHTVVELVRHRGLNFVISPSDRDTFLEQLNRAVRALSPKTH